MGSSAPDAPDPSKVIPLQTASNQQTASWQKGLNSNNVTGPTGSVTQTQTGPNQWTTATQLDPQTEALWRQQQQNQGAFGNIASSNLENNAQGYANPYGAAGTPSLQYQLNQPNLSVGNLNAGDTQKQIAGGGQQAVNAAQNAVYNQATSRLDPQYQQMQSQLNSQLSNQGIDPTSTAGQIAQANLGRQRTDAYNQANYSAVQAGQNEQNQMFGQNLAQGQFTNQAIGQDQSRNLNIRGLNNQTMQQQFANQTAAEGFNNQTQQQGVNQLGQIFGMQNSVQSPWPSAGGQFGSSVNPTDVMGAYNQQYQGQLNQYNAGQQQLGDIFGGALSLATAPLGGAGAAAGTAAGGSLFGKFVNWL